MENQSSEQSQSAGSRERTTERLRRAESGCLVLVGIGLFILVASVFLLAKTCAGGIGAGGVTSYLYEQDVTVENRTNRPVRVAVAGDLMVAISGDTREMLGPRESRWCVVEPSRSVSIGGLVSNAHGLSAMDPLKYIVWYADEAIDSDNALLIGEGNWRLLIDEVDGHLVLRTEAVGIEEK